MTTNNDELPEIFQINLEHEKTDNLDVTHIPDDKHRLAIENLVNNYHPSKIKKVGVQMTIVLKDEEPIYQRARRLSPKEREKVNEHVSEWIRDGIAQPSLSEYRVL